MEIWNSEVIKATWGYLYWTWMYFYWTPLSIMWKIWSYVHHQWQYSNNRCKGGFYLWWFNSLSMVWGQTEVACWNYWTGFLSQPAARAMDWCPNKDRIDLNFSSWWILTFRITNGSWPHSDLQRSICDQHSQLCQLPRASGCSIHPSSSKLECCQEIYS